MNNLDNKKIKDEELKNIAGGRDEFTGLPPGSKCVFCGGELEDLNVSREAPQELLDARNEMRQSDGLEPYVRGYNGKTRCKECGATGYFSCYSTE